MSGDLKMYGEPRSAGAAGSNAPATKLSLGEWCVRRGLATREEVDACLREQRKRAAANKPPVRVGELLVDRGILTPSQVTKALADQDEEIRQCIHCDLRVNVPVSTEPVEYRCPRCERPLTACPEGSPLDAIFDAPLVVGSNAVPDEVQIASTDPSRRFGKYVLLREAGRGGVGRVYRAWDTYLGQIVALKRLLVETAGEASGLDTSHVQSLIQEARSAIRLRHQGIVSVFDVGRVDREYYVSMEFIEGETLHERISAAKRRKRLSSLFEDFTGTVRILAEVARAVHHAHTRSTPIIHCDLKPGNILIDGEGHAHVVDFGLARTVQQESDEPGEISGTPSYMAPEQASGRTDRIDARTDVYAVGAILYELLTGRPPFVGMALEILDRVLVESPVAPNAVRPQLPESSAGVPAKRLAFLDDLCLRCLRKEREQRPKNLEEVALALESLPEFATLSGSPETPLVTAQLPSGPTPCPPPRRSLRRAGWGIAALLAVAAAFQLGEVVERRRTESAERRIAAHLGRFLPERALEEGNDLSRRLGTPAPERGRAVLIEEALRLAALKTDLKSALSGLPDAAVILGLHGESVDGADDQALRLRAGGRIERVGWDEIEPVRLALLVERAFPQPSPDHRFALGLFLLRASRSAEASRHLSLLRNTSLWPAAGRYLYGLDR